MVISQSHIKGGHFIKEDVALFDAAFFNFSADVAAVSYSCGVRRARWVPTNTSSDHGSPDSVVAGINV